MNKESLLGLRKLAYDEYMTRLKLGEFDANSHSINICLESIVELINHALEELKKDVHRKAKHPTGKISSGRSGGVAK